MTNTNHGADASAVSADMLRLGHTPAPGSRPVAYPLALNGRATTGALLGPDSDDRDRLLTELCRATVQVGGQVWCAAAWKHSIPSELAALAEEHFAATTTTPRDGAELAPQFGLLEAIIETRAAAIADPDNGPARRLPPILVVLLDVDEIINTEIRSRPRIGGELTRLIRRGARVGVGFLTVASTIDNLERYLQGVPLDSGACLVLGTASPVVHRALAARHRLPAAITPSRELAYLVQPQPGEALVFDLEGAC